MAGRGWIHGWRCLEKNCPASGEGESGKRVDGEAEKHTKSVGHATATWAQPRLPIEVKR